MSFWFRAALRAERPPMAVNLLSMDVIVLACAVFCGVAPLPRARAEGVLCVVCASRELLRARRVHCARRAAAAARAALGSSRVSRHSGWVRPRAVRAPASRRRSTALSQLPACAAVWRRAAELFAQRSSASLLGTPGTPHAHRSGILASRSPILRRPAFCSGEISARHQRLLTGPETAPTRVRRATV